MRKWKTVRQIDKIYNFELKEDTMFRTKDIYAELAGRPLKLKIGEYDTSSTDGETIHLTKRFPYRTSSKLGYFSYIHLCHELSHILFQSDYDMFEDFYEQYQYPPLKRLAKMVWNIVEDERVESLWNRFHKTKFREIHFMAFIQNREVERKKYHNPDITPMDVAFDVRVGVFRAPDKEEYMELWEKIDKWFEEVRGNWYCEATTRVAEKLLKLILDEANIKDVEPTFVDMNIADRRDEQGKNQRKAKQWFKKKSGQSATKDDKEDDKQGKSDEEKAEELVDRLFDDTEESEKEDDGKGGSCSESGEESEDGDSTPPNDEIEEDEYDVDFDSGDVQTRASEIVTQYDYETHKKHNQQKYNRTIRPVNKEKEQDRSEKLTERFRKKTKKEKKFDPEANLDKEVKIRNGHDSRYYSSAPHSMEKRKVHLPFKQKPREWASEDGYLDVQEAIQRRLSGNLSNKKIRIEERQDYGLDVTFVLDYSGSMGGVPINKLRSSVWSLWDAIESLPRARAEAIIYRGVDALRETTELSLVKNKDKIANYEATGGTPSYDALQFAYERLKKSTKKRLVIHVTDGSPTKRKGVKNPKERTAAVISRMRAEGIPVFTLFIIGPRKIPSNQKYLEEYLSEIFGPSPTFAIVDHLDNIHTVLRTEIFRTLNDYIVNTM